ncbi:MAG TPA: hypothetical protein DDZ53_04445 [Firmicutes bacterium]|nr:hypothetical protein [Bacillota bacterium]
MAEEQMLILRMVEEGKITADQATILLEALRPSSANVDSMGNTITHPASGNVIPEEERKVRQAMREEASQAREAAREARVQAKRIRGEGRRHNSGNTIMASLRALGIPLGGSHEYSFTRVLSGEFSAVKPHLRVQNTNGRIEVGLSDDEHWQLRLLTRIRADNEANAAALAEKLVNVESDSQRLNVEAQRMFGQNASVTIELRLPARLFAEIDVVTTNGSIQLAQLAAEKAAIKTVNGKVIGEKLEVNDLQASSVNGSVSIDGAITHLQGRATNGRVSVKILQKMNSELDLKTVNGSINVLLPEDTAIGYYLDVATTAGSIKHGLSSLLVTEEHRKPGRRTLVAASKDLEAKELRQAITARSVSGTVRVNV